jgi:hypothetical protein
MVHVTNPYDAATAATGQAVSGWQYDQSSGYYFDVQSQM